MWPMESGTRTAWDSQMGVAAIWKKLCERRDDIAAAFEVESVIEEAPPPAEEAVRNYRLVKARMLETIGGREIPRGVKAMILNAAMTASSFRAGIRIMSSADQDFIPATGRRQLVNQSLAAIAFASHRRGRQCGIASY